MTPAGRLKLVQLVIVEDWVQACVAERVHVSRATVSKWVRRYQAQGILGLADASSRPHHSPGRTALRTERRILTRGTGFQADLWVTDRACSAFGGWAVPEQVAGQAWVP